MTDRELLELAAKAAGMCGHTYGNSFCERVGNDLCKADHLWNPLTDDGDALRLAVKCNIDMILTHSDIESAFDHKCNQYAEPRGDDPYAATRRAIVRAAAEIGRNMK